MELKLYEITEEMNRINQLLEDSDGEVTPDLELSIERTSKELKLKCDNIASYARMLSDQIEMVNKRKKEIDSLEKRIKKQLERYKDYIAACLHRADIKKVEGPFSRISIPKQREAVAIDESKLDDKYFKITRSVDKLKIKEDLQRGREVNGAWFELGKESITIKMK